jgi:hypothetical protein
LAFSRLADRTDLFDLRTSGESQDPHVAAPPYGMPTPTLRRGP